MFRRAVVLLKKKKKKGTPTPAKKPSPPPSPKKKKKKGGGGTSLVSALSISPPPRTGSGSVNSTTKPAEPGADTAENDTTSVKSVGAKMIATFESGGGAKSSGDGNKITPTSKPQGPTNSGTKMNISSGSNFGTILTSGSSSSSTTSSTSTASSTFATPSPPILDLLGYPTVVNFLDLRNASIEDAALYGFWGATREAGTRLMTPSVFAGRAFLIAEKAGFRFSNVKDSKKVFAVMLKNLLHASVFHHISAANIVCPPFLPSVAGWIDNSSVIHDRIAELDQNGFSTNYLPNSRDYDESQSLLRVSNSGSRKLPSAATGGDDSLNPLMFLYKRTLDARSNAMLPKAVGNVGAVTPLSRGTVDNTKSCFSPYTGNLDSMLGGKNENVEVVHVWHAIFNERVWVPTPVNRLETFVGSDNFCNFAKMDFETRLIHDCVNPLRTSPRANRARDRLRQLKPMTMGPNRRLMVATETSFHTRNADVVPVLELAPSIYYGGSELVFDQQIAPVIKLVKTATAGVANYNNFVSDVAFACGWQHEYGASWGTELMSRYLSYFPDKVTHPVSV